MGQRNTHTRGRGIHHYKRMFWGGLVVFTGRMKRVQKKKKKIAHTFFGSFSFFFSLSLPLRFRCVLSRWVAFVRGAAAAHE